MVIIHGSRTLWTPPNSDIESGLFAMQACIGGAIMGYFFGIFHVQGRIRKEELEKHQESREMDRRRYIKKKD